MSEISFRNVLLGSILDFVATAGLPWEDMSACLAELAVELSHYTEEGVDLFPRVVVCDDVEGTLRVLQGADLIFIGEGARDPETIRGALKKCAPIARSGWAVYLERAPEKQLRFGVFREPSSPIALDLRDTIASLNEGDAAVLLGYQLARRSVEFIVGGGKRHQVHLSANEIDLPSSFDALTGVTRAAVRNLPEVCRESATSFLRTVLFRSLQNAHGTLIAVLSYSANLPSQLSNDAIMFAEPLLMGPYIEEGVVRPSSDIIGSLDAYGELLGGMVASDGITLLRSDCAMLGYRSFLRVPEPPTSEPPSQLLGGARRRAFASLKDLVGKGELDAAFFRSSDGAAEWVGKEDE